MSLGLFSHVAEAFQLVMRDRLNVLSFSTHCVAVVSRIIMPGPQQAAAKKKTNLVQWTAFCFRSKKKPNKNSNKFKRKQTNTSKGRETGKAKCSDLKEQAKQANANGQNKQRKKGTNSRN